MIGDTVWLFDENNRHYEQGHSGPIYRKYFVPYQITGETATSWILGQGVYKVDKKTQRLRCPNRGNNWYGLSSKVFWSEEDVNEACWLQENRMRLVKLVQGCYDVRVMRVIDQVFKEQMHVEE